MKVAHDLAKDMHKAGMFDEITMREIDALCLEEAPELTPQEVRKIREKTRMSQAVFAKVLGTRATTVQKWEQGQKKPSGMALRLLDVVNRKGVETLI